MAQRIGATVIQHEDFHQMDDLEHVKNEDSRHLLQPRILLLAFPHHLVSQHDLSGASTRIGCPSREEDPGSFRTRGEFSDSSCALCCESDCGRNRRELSRNRTALTQDEELSGFLTGCCGDCDSGV